MVASVAEGRVAVAVVGELPVIHESWLDWHTKDALFIETTFVALARSMRVCIPFRLLFLFDFRLFSLTRNARVPARVPADAEADAQEAADPEHALQEG